MIRVRLFRSERPIGFLSLNEAGHHMRPEGMMPDDAVESIRKDLVLGRVAGLIGSWTWYRQATPFCPLDPAKACPCEDKVCQVG
jgi:hypothetical protein